ncbi:unnamed protein product [Sphagnum jensenii]|uniref:Uncharacterized protein n=1 Tax=Sphagnum jensenii TaxID=128206 RepID=A0ABP1B918_9BRYO
MSYNPSNKECRELITNNIPWRPDEHEDHTRIGDWIANPIPPTGYPLDWVYLVLAKDGETAMVLEFQRTTPSGRIQLTTNQALRISTANYQPIRLLSQENPRAMFKVTRVPPAPGKKALIYWIYNIIQNLPWDPGEWHWLSNPPLGDAPFFGYLAKRGYTNIRKSMQTSSMTILLSNLNLRNTSTIQLTARIWHNARPRKVGTLIWLILNRGLPVGTWLQRWVFPRSARCATTTRRNLLSTVSWSAPWRNAPGKPTNVSGRNGKLLTIWKSCGLSRSWGKL